MQPADVLLLCCFTKQNATYVRSPLHSASPVNMALQDADSDAPSQGHGLSQSKASGMSEGPASQPVRSTRQSSRTGVQESKTSGADQVNKFHCCVLYYTCLVVIHQL